jgi:LysM repeat protein
MLYIGVARVQNRAGAIVTVQGALCALTLGLSLVWLPSYGIAGVGLAWLFSQALVAAPITLAHLRLLIRREHTMHTLTTPIAEALAGIRGLGISLLLIALLVLRQFLQAAGGARARNWSSVLQFAIVPLLVVFGITVTLRLAEGDESGVAQAPPTPHATATAAATPHPTATRTATPQPSPTATAQLSPIAYVVQPGDMLRMLALRFGTTVKTIAALNPRINPDSLVVGQVITIPAPRVPTPTLGPDEIAYTIRVGDTLYYLALRFGTTMEAIAALNPRINPNSLVVDQVIRIPAERPQPVQEPMR